MEVAEEEEGPLEGVAPRRVEQLRELVGGGGGRGEVEGGVVGLEVAVEGVDGGR